MFVLPGLLPWAGPKKGRSLDTWVPWKAGEGGDGEPACLGSQPPPEAEELTRARMLSECFSRLRGW